MIKNLPADAGDSGDVSREDPLEEEMATHSSVVAWRIYGQRSLAGCSPWGCKRLRHDFVTKQQQRAVTVQQ